MLIESGSKEVCFIEYQTATRPKVDHLELFITHIIKKSVLHYNVHFHTINRY